MNNRYQVPNYEHGVIADEISFDDGKWIRVIKRKYEKNNDLDNSTSEIIELKGKKHLK